jgi:hypothetical protein
MWRGPMSQNMLKRQQPDEQADEQPMLKKSRKNNLEAMKEAMQGLIKVAETHHEEVRIAAIDAAFEIEEQHKEAKATKDQLLLELDELKNDLEETTTALGMFQQHPTYIMLEKAAMLEHPLGLETLVEDNSKRKETITAMTMFKQELQLAFDSKHAYYEETHLAVNALEDKLAEAEERVQAITELMNK